LRRPFFVLIRKNPANPANAPDFVNRVTRYCRSRFRRIAWAGATWRRDSRSVNLAGAGDSCGCNGGSGQACFAAFAVIAGMGLVISAGAGMVLGHLGESMVDLSARDIPRLAASLQLSAQSASLASQGPALLASRNEEALNERTKKIKETQGGHVRQARRGHRTRRRQSGGRRSHRNREEHRR